jgi:uncharacterized protein with HEPN domain
MFKYEAYIGDLLEAIRRIEDSTTNVSFNTFKKNLELIDATGMRCQVIGESVNKLPRRILKKYPQVRWRYLKEIRNLISHDYFTFNIEVMWDFVKNEVPKINKEINKIKKELN